MPFDELQALRCKMGVRKFNADVMPHLSGQPAAPSVASPATHASASHDMARGNKSRPREMSSKKPVSRLRQVVDQPSVKRRDPRFDDLSGNLNADLFRKSYTFLEDYKRSESEELHKSLKKEKDKNRRHAILSLISNRRQEEQQMLAQEQRQAVKRQLRKKEQERVKQGKRPFYLKKADEKKLELITKYNKLKDAGKVDDYLSKRRKKKATKDQRYVPYERR